MVEIDAMRADKTGHETASIGSLFSRVSQDVRTFVAAQIAVYRIDATRRGISAGIGVGLFLAALCLFQAALVALLVGLVMLLSLPLGIGWAIVVVVGATLILTAVFAALGLGQLKRAINPDAKP